MNLQNISGNPVALNTIKNGFDSKDGGIKVYMLHLVLERPLIWQTLRKSIKQKAKTWNLSHVPPPKITYTNVLIFQNYLITYQKSYLMEQS
jgi:hypothetical protein